MTTTLTTESSNDHSVSDDERGKPTVDEWESGLEDEEQEDITEPFDPEKINIRTVTILVDQVVTRIGYREINLSPDFQRRDDIWDIKAKSRLIESLLLRIPIPAFYVSSDRKGDWEVVDGVQRMTAINQYSNNEFALSRLQYLTHLNDLKHSDLPRAFQRRIGETQLIVNVIEHGTPEEVMFNVFIRINTGGKHLSAQEIRHALHPGQVRDYLKKLAESDEFIRATNGSVNSKRMADRELILRFLAFHTYRWEKYDARGFNEYLNRIMDDINVMNDFRLDWYEKDFKKAMNAAYDIFGKNAFRKPGRRRSINRALFESWSVELAGRKPEEIETLGQRRVEIQSRFRQLMRQDNEFEKAVSYSTASRQRVQKRFSAIHELVEEFV